MLSDNEAGPRSGKEPKTEKKCNVKIEKKPDAVEKEKAGGKDEAKEKDEKKDEKEESKNKLTGKAIGDIEEINLQKIYVRLDNVLKYIIFILAVIMVVITVGNTRLKHLIKQKSKTEKAASSKKKIEKKTAGKKVSEKKKTAKKQKNKSKRKVPSKPKKGFPTDDVM